MFAQRWLHRLPLPFGAKDHDAGDWWELSMRQVEISRTIVFDAPRHARGFFEALVADNLDGMVTGQGTIYPLLARLRRQGLVGTTWRESAAGPPRRYYQLTADGRNALADFARDWSQLRESVDTLLDIGKRGEP